MTQLQLIFDVSCGCYIIAMYLDCIDRHLTRLIRLKEKMTDNPEAAAPGGGRPKQIPNTFHIIEVGK